MGKNNKNYKNDEFDSREKDLLERKMFFLSFAITNFNNNNTIMNR